MVIKRKNSSGRTYSRNEVFTPVDAYEAAIKDWLTITPDTKILVPAAGLGSDIEALLNVTDAKPANITAIEIEPDSAAEIAAKFPEVNLIKKDFLN